MVCRKEEMNHTRHTKHGKATLHPHIRYINCHGVCAITAMPRYGRPAWPMHILCIMHVAGVALCLHCLGWPVTKPTASGAVSDILNHVRSAISQSLFHTEIGYSLAASKERSNFPFEHRRI